MFILFKCNINEKKRTKITSTKFQKISIKLSIFWAYFWTFAKHTRALKKVYAYKKKNMYASVIRKQMYHSQFKVKKILKKTWGKTLHTFFTSPKHKNVLEKIMTLDISLSEIVRKFIDFCHLSEIFVRNCPKFAIFPSEIFRSEFFCNYCIPSLW